MKPDSLFGVRTAQAANSWRICTAAYSGKHFVAPMRLTFSLQMGRDLNEDVALL